MNKYLSATVAATKKCKNKIAPFSLPATTHFNGLFTIRSRVFTFGVQCVCFLEEFATLDAFFAHQR